MSAIEYDALGNMQIDAVFKGDSTMTLVEPAGSPLTSNKQIDSTKSFQIRVDWSQSGSVSTSLGTTGGSWTVEVLYDRKGGPEEGSLSLETVNAVDGAYTYTRTYDVPAGTLPPGVYDLAVLVSGQAPGHRFAGFEEISPVSVY